MIPELEPRCGSWIISSAVTGKGVIELSDRRNVEQFDGNPMFVIETAMQYLGRINYEINEEQSQDKSDAQASISRQVNSSGTRPGS